MCDVDAEGVISAPTRRRSTTSRRCCTARAWTPTSSAGSACRSGTSTGPSGATCSTGCTRPRQTVTVALVGKYIDLPDAYLSVTEALRAGGFAHRSRVQIRWVPSDDCETPEGAAAGAGRRRRRLRPRRVRRPRHRGQARRAPVHPRPTASRRSACASACSAWSSSTPATSPGWRRPTRPSSTPRRPTRSSPPWPSQVDVVAGERDMGGTMRLGSYPASLREGLGRRGGLRRRPRSPSGTGTATRSTTPTATG